MKISLALGPGGPLSRQTAWGCLTANLAVPGSGSLVAGRRVGYVQLAFTAIGFGVSLIFGAPFIIWGFSHWSQITNQNSEDFSNLELVWTHMKWPLLGIGIFAFSWIWGVLTGLGVVFNSVPNAAGKAPPKIQ